MEPAQFESIGFAVRPVTGGDTEFLFRVYASTREDFNLLPVDAAQKETLLRMQFTAQLQTFQSQFRDTGNSIVLLDEQPVARLWVDENAEEVRIVDFAVLPEFRNRGIGSQVVKSVMDRASRTGKPLRHRVMKTNHNAIQFQLGMGYAITGDDGLYLSMEWRPPRENR